MLSAHRTAARNVRFEAGAAAERGIERGVQSAQKARKSLSKVNLLPGPLWDIMEQREAACIL